MVNIAIDCEKMRRHNSGFRYFCKNLASHIIAEANPATDSVKLYLPKQEWHAFNHHENVMFHKKWHKHFMPIAKNIDIWHCTTQLSRYLPTTKHAKIVLTIHDLNVIYEHPDDATLIKKILKGMQQRIDRADLLVTISDYVKNDVLKHLRIDDKPMLTIHNGCCIPVQQPLTSPKKQPQKPFLFALGYVNAKKNFHVLPCLLKENDYLLVIGGVCDDPAYKEKIVAEARKHQVFDRVVFTGGLSENDKNWYFLHCEAFLFPSLAEGFGLPAVEAMYFGKPVFLSKKTCLPEIGGDAAFYFQNFDAEHMQNVFVDGMLNFINDRSYEVRLRQQAARFDWSIAAQHYLHAYHHIL